MLIYPIIGRLEQESSNFLEVLNRVYKTRKPNRKFYVVSHTNSEEKVYCIDNDKGKEVREFTMSNLNKISDESEDQPVIVNILGPLDNFRDFLKKINNKE